MIKKTSRGLMLLTFSLLFIGPSLLTKAAVDVGSKGDVEFKPNSNVINPVDPEEGGEIDPNKPATEGPLSLNYASDLMFGSHKQTSKQHVYYAEDDTLTVTETGKEKKSPIFVQLTDLRGTATGWKLSVRQNGPLRKANGAVIEGAKIALSADSVESMYGMTDKPTGLVKDQILSEDGQSHEVVTAEAGTGISTWHVFLGGQKDASRVSLTIPQGGVKEAGIYTTSLTWVLQDTL